MFFRDAYKPALSAIKTQPVRQTEAIEPQRAQTNDFFAESTENFCIENIRLTLGFSPQGGRTNGMARRAASTHIRTNMICRPVLRQQDA